MLPGISIAKDGVIFIDWFKSIAKRGIGRKLLKCIVAPPAGSVARDGVIMVDKPVVAIARGLFASFWAIGALCVITYAIYLLYRAYAG